jgi:type IV pilus assembly protein PilY1
MTNTSPQRARLALAIASALGAFAQQAHAQIVVNDTLTGAASTYNWIATGGACLTAGDSTSGTVPGCRVSSFKYYTNLNSTLVGGNDGTLGTTADPIGKGALRLTNGDTTVNGSNGNQQTGAVVSHDGFPMSGGVSITWTSVTYGGNAYKPSGGNSNGADGISFFLSDYAVEAPNGPTTVGGSGGSLGYSCSNTNGTYNGVRGGYLAVGIDEYGNFANKSDNTSSGRPDINSPSFTTTFWPGLISMRGAGDTNWTSLNTSTTYGKYYPSGTNTQAIMNATCKAGYAINNSGSDQKDSKNNTVKAGAQATNDGALPNYTYLPPGTTAASYPATFTIANQEATSATPTVLPTRPLATPITFNLTITPAGLLTLKYSINGSPVPTTVFNGFDIVAANGGLKPPALVRFGFAAGTGGGSNVHEITCFKAVPYSQSDASAGSSAQPTAKVPGGAQIYLAYYSTTNWYGTLSAYPVDADGNVGGTNGTTINWEADCQLTGSTMKSCTATPPLWSTRPLLSWNDKLLAGVSLSGTSAYTNLSSTQQSALNADSLGSSRVNFLGGDRSNESPAGTFRARTGLMGDIVDSSPVWVGQPQSPYSSTFVDKLGASPVPEGATYAAFASGAAQGRTNVVYVGSNDGFLHGFRAGTFNGTSYSATYNDGKEVLGYMPGVVANMINPATPTLDFSSGSYGHNYYVDGTPGTGDLYYNGNWHTWLWSGLGAGGQVGGAIADQTTPVTNSAIFGIDITDPSQFSGTSAASVVLGEWTPSTITCTNYPNCGQHMGMIYGAPQIRRLHNGNWAVLFGNGLNSPAGSAGLFVGVIDATSGKPTFYYYDTGVGPTSATKPVLNGISQITPVDLDGDHITDYVYAGDLLGNLWRFDLTNKSPTAWAAGSQPIFTTASGQPITTALAVASVPVGTSATAVPKVIIAFGTGQKLPLSAGNPESYSSGNQALYGVWDWNMSAWNLTSTDTKYDSMDVVTRTGNPATKPITIQSSELVTQTFTTQTFPSLAVQYRTASSNPICWANVASCAATPQMGWTMALQVSSSAAVPPQLAEQAVFNPIVIANEFVINTVIPVSPLASALYCSNPPAGGFTMALQMANGGASPQSFLPTPDNNFPTTTVTNGATSSAISVVGLGDSAVGTPAPLLGADGTTSIVSGTVGGGPIVRKTSYSGGVGLRLNWTKVR